MAWHENGNDLLRDLGPIPPDPENMNEARAGWAADAIQTFRNVTGTDACDAVADLLCNLRHLCDRDGTLQDFETAVAKSALQYRDETLKFVDDSDLAEAADGETCSGCGRASIDCSRNPCADVMANREESDLGDVHEAKRLPPEEGYTLETVESLGAEDFLYQLESCTADAIDEAGINDLADVTALIVRRDYRGDQAELWATTHPDPENSSETEFTRIG